jgi:basic membrane protein A and related proteins
MRKLLATAPLVLVLAACGGGGSSSTGGGGGGTTTTAAAPKGIRACLVSDVGRFNDKGFNQLQLEGLQRAAAQLGTQIQPIESKSASDYIPNLATCARNGTNITVAAGFLLADAMHTVAAKFPKQHFAITDYSATAAPFNHQANVEGLTYAANESGCLVGTLAALMAKQQGGKQVISAVGGVKIPPVDIWIAGYEFCAKRANPQIKILVDYSQDFVAQDKCKELALNQIAAGSQVVFNVAGACGLGALTAAKEKHVWGIGVDRDQSFLGPHILTSGVKRVDVGVYDAIRDVGTGKFAGGRDVLFNLKNNGVGVGKISPKVPKALIARMNAVRRQIVDGTLKVPSAVRGT